MATATSPPPPCLQLEKAFSFFNIMIIIIIEAQFPQFFFFFFIWHDKEEKRFIHLLHMDQAELMMKKTQLNWNHEGSDDVIRCKTLGPTRSLHQESRLPPSEGNCWQRDTERLRPPVSQHPSISGGGGAGWLRLAKKEDSYLKIYILI